MSKLSNMIGLAKKVLDSQTGQQQQGTPQGGSTGQRSWQSTLQDVAAAVGGRNQATQAPSHAPASHGYPAQGRPAAPASTDADRQAIARYDYLMQTAEPQQIEQIHAESFARLTPAQREAVLHRMQSELPPHEQPRSADVADLSRAAARTEARQPGTMRSMLAKVGTGGAIAGVAVGAVGILGAVAAGAVVSSVAGPLLENAANLGVDFESLASGVDVEGLTSSVGDLGTGALGEATAGVEDLAGSAEGAVSGLGDQVSGAGQSLSDLAQGFDPRDLF
ncbi:cation-transporting ATPase [Promicromonospora sp. Populi]|uniref:cation-transporting ATPase n=1 Tax=Promicromonospora sp. Populi TaxID=3239420 RepID=UPI0034E20BDC